MFKNPYFLHGFLDLEEARKLDLSDPSRVLHFLGLQVTSTALPWPSLTSLGLSWTLLGSLGLFREFLS